jgi:hypothetical protein
MPSLRRLALATLLGWPALPAVAAPPVDLLSHRAAYRLSLAESDVVGGLTAVRGALVMEWRASCEGWLSNQQLGFVAETPEGPGFAYDVRFSSWESIDNRQLRFNVRSFDENGETEAFRGRASLDGPGGRGVVDYALPGDVADIELPSGTMFPTQHVRSLIRAAQEGRTVVTHDVFDGSGPEALTRVTAVIGQPHAGDAVGAPGQRLWPVSLAYYGVASPEETPQFELSFELAADGVLYEVRLDYGDFTLKADLEEMERFDSPSCGP